MSPLISIVVISYNSSKFILETLESAKSQTYKNIELIISDDASTDNTVELCKSWEEKNRNLFVNTKILTVSNNTGITSNFNRGIFASNGIWIKPIAGDDALLPNCIQDNLEYISLNKHVNVLYSYNRLYENEFEEENFLGLNPGSSPTNIISDKISAENQYRLLLAGDKISFTPSLFVKRTTLLEVGIPDEDLFSEHYQTILKFTKSGYKLYFMEKETTLYRKHIFSSNNTTKDYIVKPHYFKTENFRKRYIYPFIPKDLRLSNKYCWAANQIFRIGLFNKVNIVNRSIYYFLNVVLNPFKYIIYYKSNYIKKYRDDIFYRIERNV